MPQPIRVKICGITQPEQGLAIAQLGVAALGFVCVRQSPRYVTPEQIQAIVRAIVNGLDNGLAGQEAMPLVDRVGVFVDASIEEIQQVVEQGGLNGVQLHGSESPQFCQQLRAILPQITLIKAFRVRDATTLAQTHAYQAVVDALLLDAFRPAAHPGQYGGTGHKIAWEMLRQFRPSCPWYLAGGITPHNLHEALELVQPDGIDISSGVERAPRDKDLEKVALLLTRLTQLTVSELTVPELTVPSEP
jgi:phosphoribosylanthranilate isomerase